MVSQESGTFHQSIKMMVFENLMRLHAATQRNHAELQKRGCIIRNLHRDLLPPERTRRTIKEEPIGISFARCHSQTSLVL